MLYEPTRGSTAGQFIYAVSKVWILALPIIWHVWVDQQRVQLGIPTRRGVMAGALWGVLMAAIILAGYRLFGRQVIDTEQLRSAAAQNGLDQWQRFIALALGLTFVNALLEEYVWRWFVFRKCETLMPGALAVIIAAGLFTLHHVIALRAQMGWTPTILASMGIFTGGCVWSGLYLRYRTIWPGYISHVLADLAVFTAGWFLIFG
jgi:membrane protease YdiL (CAAX protease family)